MQFWWAAVGSDETPLMSRAFNRYRKWIINIFILNFLYWCIKKIWEDHKFMWPCWGKNTLNSLSIVKIVWLLFVYSWVYINYINGLANTLKLGINWDINWITCHTLSLNLAKVTVACHSKNISRRILCISMKMWLQEY